MPAKHTKGNLCKEFRDGDVTLQVYDNHDSVQICRRAPSSYWSYVIVPKGLCKLVGTELFELGRSKPFPVELKDS